MSDVERAGPRSDWPGLGALRTDADAAVRRSSAELRRPAHPDGRERLARSMHDGLAQDLAALGFQLDLIRRVAEQAGEEHAADIAAARDEVDRILADVRASIDSLRAGSATGATPRTGK